MKIWNLIKSKFPVKSHTKISTYFGLTTSVLVTAATLGIAIYSLFFVNDIFGSLIIQNSLYNRAIIFKETLERLVLSFLLFGLLASYFMTQTVSKPLNKLIEGTKKIAQGDLKYRLTKTKYLEINQLITTYNQMAENLETLYNTLETKVKERTQELEEANNELKNTQAMMVHSEKMRSLGQLVAGITHEINNPINFIYGNMIHLKNYSKDLIDLIEKYEENEKFIPQEKLEDVKKLKEKIELDFLKEDLPLLIKSCQEGTERTKNIILNLKNFSRMDEMVINSIDITTEIETTLNILHNKIKNKIEIIKDYEENLPQIDCYGGQINQVFMNILDNSSYAIKDNGKIFIRVNRYETNKIKIEIEDTGCGMNAEQTAKIFEPFYTTKPVGEGTGLGMSISYKIIKTHNGTINIESKLGVGTKFTIILPISKEEN